MVDLSCSQLDIADCATVTEIPARTNKYTYVIDTRMLVFGDKVTAIESLIVDAGNRGFNATSQLS
jgi:hypothetical protein